MDFETEFDYETVGEQSLSDDEVEEILDLGLSIDRVVRRA